jgi:ribonuclease J
VTNGGELRIIPLGGVGEIGRNMMVVEFGQDAFIIDAGLMFPENDMLGIDIVIPDMSYLVQNRDRIRGVIVTHGHEDHTGSLPYLLRDIQAPVYATRLTRGLIEVKLKEHKLKDSTELHTIDTDQKLKMGCFQIEFFRVSHSIPDGVGLAIHTPVGIVVHSGDFKLDYSPVDESPTDISRLASLGQDGVLALLSDSTNAETPGYTPSEKEIGENFDRVTSRAPGRVIVATFASNISRVQQVIDTAVRYDRKVAVVGRSMVNNVNMAMELGYLKIPPGVLVKPDELKGLPPNRAVLVCTGSQGEPTSALVRMAERDSRQVRLVPGDTVIVSATPIPGNEELVNRTLNNLFREGADVYYDQLLDVHVSGHASQEEQKLLISLLRPRFFVPIHGEYRHLVLHAKLAQQVGIPSDNVLIAQSGDVLEFTRNTGRISGHVPGGRVFVDGLGVGDIGGEVLRDRRLLSRDGFLVAVVALDKETGKSVSGPDIFSHGFVYMKDSEELIEEARIRILAEVEESGKRSGLQGRLRDALGQFLYQRTKRRPLIIPIVLEV